MSTTKTVSFILPSSLHQLASPSASTTSTYTSTLHIVSKPLHRLLPPRKPAVPPKGILKPAWKDGRRGGGSGSGVYVAGLVMLLATVALVVASAYEGVGFGCVGTMEEDMLLRNWGIDILATPRQVETPVLVFTAVVAAVMPAFAVLLSSFRTPYHLLLRTLPTGLRMQAQAQAQSQSQPQKTALLFTALVALLLLRPVLVRDRRQPDRRIGKLAAALLVGVYWAGKDR